MAPMLIVPRARPRAPNILFSPIRVGQYEKRYAVIVSELGAVEEESLWSLGIRAVGLVASNEAQPLNDKRRNSVHTMDEAHMTTDRSDTR